MEPDKTIHYGIWCEVRGGVTGRRMAWMKNDGDIVLFDSEAVAQSVAGIMQTKANGPNATAQFAYSARLYRP